MVTRSEKTLKDNHVGACCPRCRQEAVRQNLFIVQCCELGPQLQRTFIGAQTQREFIKLERSFSLARVVRERYQLTQCQARSGTACDIVLRMLRILVDPLDVFPFSLWGLTTGASNSHWQDETEQVTSSRASKRILTKIIVKERKIEGGILYVKRTFGTFGILGYSSKPTDSSHLMSH